MSAPYFDDPAVPAAGDLDLSARAAVEYRRERDRREPLKRDLEAERKTLIRDFIAEALTSAARDLDAALLSVENDDDVGTVHHFRRLLAAVKHAAQGYKELAA